MDWIQQWQSKLNKQNGVAPLVRTGGSRHTGLAALPHRNIHGFCQSGTKQEKDGTGGGVSGTVGDAVQCAVRLCGRLQHGEVCVHHDLRRFYRQHTRLFPLQPGR